MKPTHSPMDADAAFHREVLGWCVKQRRLARHLSQEALADLALLSREVVQHVERGQDVREGVQMRICWALGTSIVELTSEVDRVKRDWQKNGRPQESNEARITGGLCAGRGVMIRPAG